MYAPTQAGKTSSMADIVCDCIRRNISVVISAENKKESLEQLTSRIEASIRSAGLSDAVDFFRVTESKRSLERFRDGMNVNRPFVICCMDNHTQIRKLGGLIAGRIPKKAPFVIIHDEGDLVIKADTTRVPKQCKLCARRLVERSTNHIFLILAVAKSHKEWDVIVDTLLRDVSVKRVFVTATPESVVAICKPEKMFEIVLSRYKNLTIS